MYYLPAVTQIEAEKVAAFLEENWGLDQSEATMQLRKESGAYELAILLKEGIDVDSITGDMSRMACGLESEIFDGAYVNVLAFDSDATSFRDEILRREFCR